MAALVHFDTQGRWGETLLSEQRIAETLHPYGLDHGRWPLRDLGDGSLETVLAAYGPELGALRERLAIRSIDRVHLQPGDPGWPALRAKFLTEHTHADAEIRYFLGGAGLFYVPVPDGHLGLLCETEDWVVVPAGTPHFFDAGDAPDFDALRLFTAPDGWAAQPTGAAAPALPLLDAFALQLREVTGYAGGQPAA